MKKAEDELRPHYKRSDFPRLERALRGLLDLAHQAGRRATRRRAA